MDGLFNLTGFESASNDDLLSMSINEEAEFKDHCPSSDPTQHVDASASGNKEIPVPGGNNEKPSAKPADGETGPTIPGGDSETPKSKPADSTSMINTPKVALDDKTYNSVLDQLQKSFKEASEMVQMIRDVAVITESVEEQQEKFVESAIDKAILESIENGPLFERVDRSDKNDVKELVSKLRGSIEKEVKDQDYHFYQPKIWARILVGGFATAAAGIGTTHFAAGVSNAIQARLWQILGICYSEEGNIGKLCDHLNEKFKNELGEYKILQVKTVPTIADAFRTHFGWKDNRGTYMLLIDKKLPAEIEKLQNEVVDAVKKEAPKEEKKEEKK